MVHLYSAFIQSALQCALHSPIHTHIHTPVAVETMQGTNQLTGGNLGFFSVLPKDTSTCRQEKLGFEPLTHGALANPLYLLSYSRPFTVVYGN